MRGLLAALALAGAALPSSAGRGDGAAFVETVVRIPSKGTRLALEDFTGDGRRDLLHIDAVGIALYPQAKDGTFPAEPSARLPFPADRIGWDLGDLDGDGAPEVAFLLEETGVRVHAVDAAGAFDAGTQVLVAETRLPAGASRVRFVRDIDGDGRADLVLPGPGAHRIHLAREDGWAPPFEVAYELDATYLVGDPETLSSSFGQVVSVPWFQIEDVDGDGRDDLVSRTDERVAVHLANPELASLPTWVLDLAALRAELPKKDSIDFDNLFSAVDQQVDWQFADIDGVPPRDLVVSLGPKFRVYLGGARTGPTGTPDQVLKSSGNVLLHYVRDVQGDALPDLQLIRGERISIGRVLRALILASSIDFDIFTYRNEGGAFSRHPTKRNRVTIELPRLLSLTGMGDGLELTLGQQFDARAARLTQVPGQPAAGDDVADVMNGELVVYRGCAPAPNLLERLRGDDANPLADRGQRLVEGLLLQDLDGREDGASRTIGLEDLVNLDFAPAAALQAACAGRTPDLRQPLVVDASLVTSLVPRDLDGDGRADVIVVAQAEQQWIVQLLVVR